MFNLDTAINAVYDAQDSNKKVLTLKFEFGQNTAERVKFEDFLDSEKIGYQEKAVIEDGEVSHKYGAYEIYTA